MFQISQYLYFISTIVSSSFSCPIFFYSDTSSWVFRQYSSLLSIFSHLQKTITILYFSISHEVYFYTFRGFNKVKLESYNWHLIKVFWHLRSVHFKAQCKVHFIQDIISESKLHLKLCKVQSTSNGKIALSLELFCKLQISAMSISIMAIEINSQECSH